MLPVTAKDDQPTREPDAKIKAALWTGLGAGAPFGIIIGYVLRKILGPDVPTEVLGAATEIGVTYGPLLIDGGIGILAGLLSAGIGYAKRPDPRFKPKLQSKPSRR